MKVNRRLLGKVVEIEWMDPCCARVPTAHALTGRAALATWREFGVVDDITDGVVVIVHSAGREPGASATDEVQRTVLPEVLIEKITVYRPAGRGK